MWLNYEIKQYRERKDTKNEAGEMLIRDGRASK